MNRFAKISTLTVLFAAAAASGGQVSSPAIEKVAGDPTGNACTNPSPLQWYAGTYYGCDNTGHRAALAGGSGSGTVSSGVKGKLAGYLANGATVSGLGDVIFASGYGCALNSNISTGGGSDDTTCIQNGLNAVSAAGGGVFVQDGVSLITNVLVNGTTHTGCIMEPPNVDWHFQPGSGLFLQANSNCTAIENTDITGNPAGTVDANFGISGPGILNFNGPNQSKYEQGVNTNGWNYGIWFGSFNHAWVNDVVIENARTFSLTWSNGQNFENLNTTFNQAASPGGANTDGIHMYGTLNQGIIKNVSFLNLGDDGLAFNTDEAVNSYNEDISDPNFGLFRYCWQGGNITNVLVQNAYWYNSASVFRIIGYVTANGTVVLDNIILKNLMGSSLPSGGTGIGGAEIHNITVDGFHVELPSPAFAWETSANPSLFNVTASDIEPTAAMFFNSAYNSFQGDYQLRNKATTPVTITSYAGTFGADYQLVSSGTVQLAAASTTTVNVAQLQAGDSFTLYLTQDGSGSNTVTLGTGCTWKQGTSTGFVTSTIPTLTAPASGTNILAAQYDGTNCWYNLR